jgi:DNA repair protein RecN (Recombination protein N)
MIRELYVQNYAIIEEVSLLFEGGFNVITGETGAGKSILVGALSLVLGGRSSAEEIRSGKDEALLQARFDPIESQAEEDPDELDSDEIDPDAIILKRVLSKSGKNRIYCNGSLANLSTLKQVGQKLAEIHGQHEHHNLIDLDWQLHLLDGFGRLWSDRSRYKVEYQAWFQLQNERAELEKKYSEGKNREALLKYQLSEILEIKLQPHEEEALQKEEKLLKSWDAILSLTQKAYSLLSDEGAVLSQLDEIGTALQDLHALTDHPAPEIELWETSKIHLREVALSLRARLDGGEYNPERLNEVTERLYKIQKLKKKYGLTLGGLLDYQQQLESDLSGISNAEIHFEEIEAKIASIRKRLQSQAEFLSQKRFEVKTKLEKKVKEELNLLGMEKTRFEISFRDVPLSENGVDRIEFLIALPGEMPQGLEKIASGGELSRLMLALKVVLAEVDPVPTLVFDEVDAGIGGSVAERVGRRLSRLAESHQVFCITHLPQIACFADHHFYVEKNFIGDRVVTSIKELSKAEKVQELARMLGGVTITPITLRHAEEMIALKKNTDESTPPRQTKKTKRERNR